MSDSNDVGLAPMCTWPTLKQFLVLKPGGLPISIADTPAEPPSRLSEPEPTLTGTSSAHAVPFSTAVRSSEPPKTVTPPKRRMRPTAAIATSRLRRVLAFMGPG